MKRLIQIISPADSTFTPMNFTRQPVVQRFWYGGLAAGLAGFALGFALWMWQHGILAVEGDFYLYRLWHARVQIEGFLGSFLLGFALQSGPHVAGGKPPASSHLLHICHLLWAGLVISLAPDDRLAMVGAGLVSVAYGAAGYFLFGVTIQGNPRLRLPRGIPLAVAMTLMAAAPWLPLEDPGVALFLLWCGPATMAMVAAQQLIQNVMGGSWLQDRGARHFVYALVAAWITSAAAAFVTWGSWRVAGACWLLTLILLLHGTGFVPAARRFGWASINVTLSLGFFHAVIGALWMLFGEGSPDVAVHLLGAAFLTTLIVGVTVRVVGFFSAGAVVSDRVASYLVGLWGVVAWSRSFSPVWPMEERWTLWMSLVGAAILGLWGARTGYRLLKIRDLVPVSLGGRKAS
ncbi:MAG: NnrS family protein [Magnetococcales bacterium]|nr:NnrS family protein [Magnetococcales bacterium]